MEELKDSLKQFIDSRLREATRLQAIYPENAYVGPLSVRKLNLEFSYLTGAEKTENNGFSKEKTDFRW